MSCSSSLSSIFSRSLGRRTPTPLAAASFLARFPSTSTSASASTSSLLRRSLSSTPRRWDSSAPAGISAPKDSIPGSSSSDGSSGITATWIPAEGNESKAPLRIDHEPKLSLTFTCTATRDPTPSPPSSPEASVSPTTPVADAICNHRSTHTFSKQAYTKGIVLVQCPSCENRHLIADHIGWFPEVTEAEGGKRVMRDIQDIMREKGEEVKRGSLTGGEDGTIEFYQ